MDHIKEIKRNLKLLLTIAYSLTDSLEDLEESINENVNSARLRTMKINQIIEEKEKTLKVLNMTISKISKTDGEGFNLVCDGKIYSVKEQ